MKQRNALTIGLVVILTLVMGIWTNSASAIETANSEKSELADFYAVPFLSDTAEIAEWNSELANFYAAQFSNKAFDLRGWNTDLADFYAAQFLKEASEFQGWITLEEYYANYFGNVWFDNGIALSQ